MAACTCIHHLIWNISYYLLTLPQVSNCGEMVVAVMDSHLPIMASTPGPSCTQSVPSALYVDTCVATIFLDGLVP